MPALENPKHEMVAQAFVALPIAKQAYRAGYPDVQESTAETKGPALVRNAQVRDRIQELLEGNGLTNEYLIKYGKERFLDGEDPNVAQKAWKTYLEIAGIINTDQSLTIANIVFNENIVAPQPVDNSAQPQDLVGHDAKS